MFLFFIILGVCLAGAGAGFLYWAVVAEPGEEIQPENIQRILGKESHVFYSDGKTKLGVFFDTAHRQYVSYPEIPSDFVNALVASEDDRFFQHIGFDIIGITRAMIRNIQAGRVVQGGSTLTQQTAKNLYKRTERSFEAKLKELIYSLRLEYHYPKEKIFEFYANQFYVSGNGHGLGVAARYYFDKRPEELSLVQCAFIAGSVKRPNFYNPFIKKTKEAADLARTRASIRLKYVLGKMRELGMISDFIYSQALATDFTFKQGKVGYSLDYAMEQVKDAVSSTEVLGALKDHNIDNIATSGVNVITTIDKEVQEKTLSILRRELSRLDVRLRGYERKDVQAELADLNYSGDSTLKKGAYLFGNVEQIEGKGKDVEIVVALDKKLGKGVIYADGLSHLVKARVKWQKNRWSEPKAEDLDALVKELEIGDRLWVSVQEILDGQTAVLDLQKYPQVQGGALAIRNGAIIGMAGGTENRFFNRAIHARRTMGSAFKPFVYTAAIQLGWNSADVLRNSRDVFVYHDQPYFPRPDHVSSQEWVSMSWAGVRSENIASVWLLSHLCDQLNSQQFLEVAQNLGFAPKVVDGLEEPYRTYGARIRDRYGIKVNRNVLRSAAYRLALENMETDFIFDGMVEEYRLFKQLRFGHNFEIYTEKLEEEFEEKFAEKEKKPNKFAIAEFELRKSILANNYILLESLRSEVAAFKTKIDTGWFEERDPFDPLPEAAFFVDVDSGEVSYSRFDRSPTGQLVDGDQLRTYLGTLDRSETLLFWEKVKLNGTVSVGAFDKLATQVAYEYQKLSKQKPYSFDVLSNVDDFRITVGLYYCIRLAEQLGIKSKLEPVLSFALGSNVVSLLETTRMYEAMVTGKITTFGDPEQGENYDSLAIIDRIESAEGELLYQPMAVTKNVIDPKTSLAIGHILENVVKFGTGRLANKNVRLGDGSQSSESKFSDLNISVPVFGKTGTANRYSNASFFGFLPIVADNNTAMEIKDGYAIGVYVGFDDNRSMRKKNSRITGSAGALPAWTQIVNVLLEDTDFAARLDPVDLSFYGLSVKRENLGQINVLVDPEEGGKVREPAISVSNLERYKPSILTFGRKTDAGSFRLERSFQPFWKTVADGVH